MLLQRKSLVACLGGYRSDLGILVTLLDAYLTVTHFGSVLAPQTAFQDSRWLLVMILSLCRSVFLS